MTPEELNRTLDFIAQSQARLAVAQEEDRERRIEFQEWSRNLSARLARLAEEQLRLIAHQSQRIDWNEMEQMEYRKRNEELQRRYEELRREMQQQHNDAMAKLDRFIDRLFNRPN